MFKKFLRKIKKNRLTYFLLLIIEYCVPILISFVLNIIITSIIGDINESFFVQWICNDLFIGLIGIFLLNDIKVSDRSRRHKFIHSNKHIINLIVAFAVISNLILISSIVSYLILRLFIANIIKEFIDVLPIMLSLWIIGVVVNVACQILSKDKALGSLKK